MKHIAVVEDEDMMREELEVKLLCFAKKMMMRKRLIPEKKKN